MRIVYLHGFASSPQSRKAQYFAHRFAEKGIELHIPQIDGNDFEHLTVTGQLKILSETVASGRVVLMGSSLGGYLSAWFAAHHPEKVEKLVLLAPAFRFLPRWRERLKPEGLEHWRQTGKASVFHYGSGGQRDLGYEFIEDAARYEDEPQFNQPALVCHGLQDDVVPASYSEAYAVTHPNVQLRLYSSGHELTDMLDPIWEETVRFLFQK